MRPNFEAGLVRGMLSKSSNGAYSLMQLQEYPDSFPAPRSGDRLPKKRFQNLPISILQNTSYGIHTRPSLVKISTQRGVYVGSGNDLPQTQAKQELALAKIVSVIEGVKNETETIL
jgi:hypothetical protein